MKKKMPAAPDVRSLGTPRKKGKPAPTPQADVAETAAAVITLDAGSVPPSNVVDFPSTDTETMSVQEKPVMNFTLTLGKVSKSGKRAQFASAALGVVLTLPARLFVNKTLPQSFVIDTDAFATLGADEQAKAEARNAKRAEKGLKPKKTPAERAEALQARIAKQTAKLARAQAAAAKLSEKLGTPAADASASA